MINILKNNWPIFGILFLSAFLRFWNLSGLLHFTLDEELEAFIVKNIVMGFHFPAIGISVAPVGIHLSPIFYYVVALPFWLGNLDPLVWGVTASVLGVATTLTLFLTTKVMFSKRIAIFASLLYAGSFLMVLYDKHFWNVMFMPLITIVTIYSLYQVLHKKYWWTIPLSASLALGVSSHLSSGSLVILVLLVWFRYKLPILRREILAGLVILVLSQLPLLIFELRHQFSQTQALLKFLTGEHSGINLTRVIENIMLLPKVFSRLIYTFGPHDFAREHTYGLVEIIERDLRIPAVMLLIVFFLLGYLGFVIIKNRQSEALRLHGLLVAVTVASLVLYGILFKGNVFEFYLALLFPTLFLALALFLDWLWIRGTLLRVLAIVFVSVFVIANGWAVFTSYHSYGFARKLEIVNWVKREIGDRPYELHSIGENHKYEGYRYLFERFFKAPIKSYVDPQLAWLYQSPIASSSPELLVVITASEDPYREKIKAEKEIFLPWKIAESQFGEINAMIVSTSGLKKDVAEDN